MRGEERGKGSIVEGILKQDKTDEEGDTKSTTRMNAQGKLPQDYSQCTHAYIDMAHTHTRTQMHSICAACVYPVMRRFAIALAREFCSGDFNSICELSRKVAEVV